MEHVRRLLTVMSKGDKSAFSHANKGQQQTHFYQIYEYLCKHKTAEIDQLRSKFSQVPQLSYEINNLYQRLLRSMIISGFGGKKPREIIQKKLAEVELLTYRGLGIDAIRILQRAKKQSEAIEDFELLFRCIEYERKLADRPGRIDRMLLLEKALGESALCLQKIQETNEFRYLLERCIKLAYEHFYILEPHEIPQDLDTHPKMLASYPTLSVKGAFMHSMVLGCWNSLNSKIEEATVHFNKGLKLAENHQKILGIDSAILSYNNLLNLYFIAGDSKGFHTVRAHMLKMAEEHPSRKHILEFYCISFPIELAARTGNYENLAEYLRQTEDFKSRSSHLMSQVQQDFVHKNMIAGYLFLGDLNRASDHLISLQNANHRAVVKLDLRILSICTHIALGNNFLLESELGKLKRTIQKENVQNPALQLFVKYVSQVMHQPLKEAQHALLFQQSLEKLLEQPSNFRYLLRFNFLNWLKRKHKSKQHTKL